MSNKIKEKEIWVTQGDSLPILLDFHQDITGAEILMQVRDLSGRVIIDKKVRDHTDAVQGLTMIRLTADDTNKEPGCYQTDMEIRFADGTCYTFYPASVGAKACFHITNQITKEDE